MTGQTEGQFQDQQRGTTLAVKQAFTTMLLAKGALKVAQDELQNYHQQLDIFRVRYNDGDIGKIDFSAWTCSWRSSRAMKQPPR